MISLRGVIYTIRWFTWCSACGKAIIRAESGTSLQEIHCSITELQKSVTECDNCHAKGVKNAQG